MMAIMVYLSDMLMMIMVLLRDIMFYLQSELDVFVKRLSTSMCVGSVTNVANKIVNLS